MTPKQQLASIRASNESDISAMNRATKQTKFRIDIRVVHDIQHSVSEVECEDFDGAYRKAKSFLRLLNNKQASIYSIIRI